MKKETILETVDDFVNFVLKFYYIKSRYTLEVQKNNVFVDKEAGDKWEDEYYGIAFADSYISEVGNELAKLHPELDFIIIINMEGLVSYRTAKDIDVSEVAKMFGGGGHKKASGSQFSSDLTKEFIYKLFEVNDEEKK